MVSLVETQAGLEYIGLAKNRIGPWESAKVLFDNIGRFPLTNEQADEHKNKERDREAAIQKNIKVIILIIIRPLLFRINNINK